MFTDIVWRFLIIETFVMGALCSLFTNKHPQALFCESEFVLRVEIVDEFKWPSLKIYFVLIKTRFKGDFQDLNVYVDKYVFLTMPINCTDVNISTGDKYFIFGRKKSGHINIDNCYGIKPTVNATPFYKRGLTLLYKNGCECNKELPKYTVAKKCHWNHSYLVKNGDGCIWMENKFFRLCKS